MIRTLRPTGDGASTQCSRVGDSANWRCVDEASSDGDTTHVACASDGLGNEIIWTDSYAMADLPAGLLGAISKVRVFLIAKYQFLSPGHAKIRPQIRIGSIYYIGTEIDLAGSYASTSKEWATNPATSAVWTAAAVNSAQAVQRLRALDDGTGTPTEVRSTMLYMEVEHVRVFQPTAAASMAMGGPQAAFYHPGPPPVPSAPPKLSAALSLRQSGSGSVLRSGGASFAAQLRRLASLPAWISPGGVASIPTFPQYSGLLYTVGSQALNPGFTTHVDTVAATGAMIAGILHAFPNQAAFEVTRYYDNGAGSTPNDPLALLKIFREANPTCLLGMYINAMQVPLTQPAPGQFVYKPMEKALFDWITAHDSWLRRISNGAIFEGKADWGVFDVRAAGFPEFYGALVRQYLGEYGIDRVFLDETHYTVEHLAGHADIANKPSDVEQTAGMRAILLASSGGDAADCVWNGLMTKAMAPESYGGRMIQGAASSTAATVITAMQEAVTAYPMQSRISMLEQQSDTLAQRQYMACLATLYDGQSGCGANDFTTPIDMPYVAGSWGRPLEYVNGTSTIPVTTLNGNVETRELEFATVGVDRSTKTAIVTPRP